MENVSSIGIVGSILNPMARLRGQQVQELFPSYQCIATILHIKFHPTCLRYMQEAKYKKFKGRDSHKGDKRNKLRESINSNSHSKKKKLKIELTSGVM
jgi:hypothetical protein